MPQMTCRFIHQDRRVMYGIGIYTTPIPYVPGSQEGSKRHCEHLGVLTISLSPCRRSAASCNTSQAKFSAGPFAFFKAPAPFQTPLFFCPFRKRQSVTEDFRSSDRETTGLVLSPRHFPAKSPWGCPLQNKNALYAPPLHPSRWAWCSLAAKEPAREAAADPGHPHKSPQGSRPTRLLPRDKRKALLLRGADTGSTPG